MKYKGTSHDTGTVRKYQVAKNKKTWNELASDPQNQDGRFARDKSNCNLKTYIKTTFEQLSQHPCQTTVLEFFNLQQTI